jgi:hypothetical protein
MLTASASGLGSGFSSANAALQVERVARSRGVPTVEIRSLLHKCITRRSLGIFGEPTGERLALNLALQRAYPKHLEVLAIYGGSNGIDSRDSSVRECQDTPFW